MQNHVRSVTSNHNGVIAKSGLMANGLRLMSVPKTSMTLKILECSIERVKHALNDGEFFTRTIASVQLLLGLHVGCLRIMTVRLYNECEENGAGKGIYRLRLLLQYND